MIISSLLVATRAEVFLIPISTKLKSRNKTPPKTTCNVYKFRDKTAVPNLLFITSSSNLLLLTWTGFTTLGDQLKT